MWCFVKFVLPRSCLDRENTSLSLTFLFGQLLWASLPKFFGRIWQHFPPLVSTLEYFANCTLRDVWGLLWNRNSATLVTGLATATTVTIATVSKRRIGDRGGDKGDSVWLVLCCKTDPQNVFLRHLLNVPSSKTKNGFLDFLYGSKIFLFALNLA